MFAVTAVYVILWVVVNALFADALVQRDSIDQRTLSSAFWASTLVGCVAMLLQDPFTMLNPVMRCGAHIEEMLRKEVQRRNGEEKIVLFFDELP